MQIPPLRRALGAHIGQVLTPELACAIEVAAAGSVAAYPPPWPRSTPDALLELMAGNKDAAAMLEAISFWSHIYDDLIDRDKPVSDTDIHKAMWVLLVDLPRNPFFRAHETEFRGALVTGVMNWHAANQMEKSGCVEQLRIAHAIRYSAGDVAFLAMVFAGGEAHAIANASRCRLLMQHDTWQNYIQEHSHADSM